MILVFSLVFVFLFLLGYLKKFPRQNKLKMIFAVTVFSILVSFHVSFLTVYTTYHYWLYHPVLTQFSLPFHLEVEYGPVNLMWDSGPVWFRIFLADVQLLEVRSSYTDLREDLLGALFQSILIFTALNLLAVPLAVFTYELTEKIVKKLPKIPRFKEPGHDNSSYR